MFTDDEQSLLDAKRSDGVCTRCAAHADHCRCEAGPHLPPRRAHVAPSPTEGGPQ